jgi:hypothetical protein
MPLVLLATLAVVVPADAAKEDHRLVSEWTEPDFGTPRFEKIFIIGIADLTEARKQFEDRFVSHLRSRNIDGVPSHGLVPQLDRVEDRTAIVVALEDLGVDAAITVRLVPLDDQTEKEWEDAWRRQTESKPRIRGLIEESLPPPEKKAKRYGVEVALWESGDWSMIWAARSDAYKRKELTKEAAYFVELTISSLRNTGLLP